MLTRAFDSISEARGLCRAPKDTNTHLTFPQHPQKDPQAVSFSTQRGCPAQKQILLSNPSFFSIKKNKTTPNFSDFFFHLGATVLAGQQLSPLLKYLKVPVPTAPMSKQPVCALSDRIRKKNLKKNRPGYGTQVPKTTVSWAKKLATPTQGPSDVV